MSLYATKTRLRFLQAVGDEQVYSQPRSWNDDRRDSYFVDGGKCTAWADEAEAAGWIERGGPVDGMPEKLWWQCTELGREVLKSSTEKEQSDDDR